MSLSSDRQVLASISHDECVKFWDMSNLSNIKIDASSKSKSKSSKNKKLASNGKSVNFFLFVGTRRLYLVS